MVPDPVTIVLEHTAPGWPGDLPGSSAATPAAPTHSRPGTAPASRAPSARSAGRHPRGRVRPTAPDQAEAVPAGGDRRGTTPGTNRERASDLDQEPRHGRTLQLPKG